MTEGTDVLTTYRGSYEQMFRSIEKHIQDMELELGSTVILYPYVRGNAPLQPAFRYEAPLHCTLKWYAT